MPKIKSRRQLKADRKREENKLSKQREQDAFLANAQRLRSMTSGLSTQPYGTSTGRLNVSAPQEQRLTNPLVTKPVRRETREIKSLVTMDFSKIELRLAARMSEEMVERERIAQKEIERKKKRVGILYNKGAYQYITDETDLTTLGKK